MSRTQAPREQPPAIGERILSLICTAKTKTKLEDFKISSTTKRAVALSLTSFGIRRRILGADARLGEWKQPEAIQRLKTCAQIVPENIEDYRKISSSIEIRRALKIDRELRQVIAADAQFSLPYMWRLENFLTKKMWREAIAAIQKFVELSAESVLALSVLGFAYGSAGMKDEALKAFEQLDGLSKDGYVGSFWRALLWIGLAEKNSAFENLERDAADLFFVFNGVAFDELDHMARLPGA